MRCYITIVEHYYTRVIPQKVNKKILFRGFRIDSSTETAVKKNLTTYLLVKVLEKFLFEVVII